MRQLSLFFSKISSLLPEWVWFLLSFLLVHLPGLTALPVFADEAIYIRWAQLVVDEPYRYAFFSMADGKPPLFIWILSSVLHFGSDPLFIGRFLAVSIGAISMFVIGKLAKLLTGRTSVQRISMLIVMLSPFWWMYHRMSLMDGLLSLCIALSFYFALRIAIYCQKEKGIAYDMVPNVLLLGASFGAALMTKTPALFAIPGLALVPLFSLVRLPQKRRSIQEKLSESVVMIGIGGMIGCVFFLMLRVSPLFGALFSRSSDFTFTFRELLSGEWKFVLTQSIPRELSWISWYMTYPVLLFTVVGLCMRRSRKTVALLILCAFCFAAPLIGFGRVLYPRYFLPVAIYLTISGAIGVDLLLRKKNTVPVVCIIGILAIVQSFSFIIPALSSVERIPFVAIDRMQYLEEWSAGYGNAQVRDLVRQRYVELAGQKKIIVLTEGSFGTLPDGVLMYFWGSNQLDGVEVHGIGVGPALIPEQYLAQRSTAEIYYVVNSHRFKIENTSLFEKVLEVHRPNLAPSLLVFKLR